MDAQCAAATVFADIFPLTVRAEGVAATGSAIKLLLAVDANCTHSYREGVRSLRCVCAWRECPLLFNLTVYLLEVGAR